MQTGRQATVCKHGEPSLVQGAQEYPDEGQQVHVLYPQQRGGVQGGGGPIPGDAGHTNRLLLVEIKFTHFYPFPDISVSFTNN